MSDSRAFNRLVLAFRSGTLDDQVDALCGREGGIIDHCPKCGDEPPSGSPMTAVEAEVTRRERHAEIRRATMRATSKTGADDAGT